MTVYEGLFNTSHDDGIVIGRLKTNKLRWVPTLSVPIIKSHILVLQRYQHNNYERKQQLLFTRIPTASPLYFHRFFISRESKRNSSFSMAGVIRGWHLKRFICVELVLRGISGIVKDLMVVCREELISGSDSRMVSASPRFSLKDSGDIQVWFGDSRKLAEIP